MRVGEIKINGSMIITITGEIVTFVEICCIHNIWFGQNPLDTVQIFNNVK
jgi:hypothetical protein